MSRTRLIMVLAGVSMGMSGVALAQNQLDNARAYGSDLLSDASTRTSTLAAGDNAVDVGGQIQFRYYWNNRSDDALSEEDANGFQTRRTKAWMTSDIAENWSVEVVLSAERDGGAFILENAIVKYQANENSNVMWGQFKAPFMRQDSVADSHQLLAERSIMVNAFGQGWTQGIQYSYTGDQFRFMASLNDGNTNMGIGTAQNSDFTSGSEADFALTARGEFMWNGEWKQFDDITSPQGSAYAGLLGLAAHWQSGGETFGTADQDAWAVTLDVGAEGDGWNVFADAVWRNIDPAGGSDLTDWGLGIQGGWYMNADWELIGRWSLIVPDEDAVPDDSFNEFAVGVNYYVLGGGNHSAKFTFDINFFPDETTSNPIVPTSTGTGLLPSADESQWFLRFQFQALF